MSPWLRLHAMALADAWRRVAGQPLASAVAMAVIALAVALPVLAYVIVGNATRAAGSFDADPHINVFLALDATDEDARRVEAALKARPESAAVRFIPRGKALEELKASSHLADLLAQLDRNPLPHAFSVRMKTRDAERLSAVRADWLTLPRVDQVSADFEWAEKLSRATRFAQRAVAGLIAILAAAVLLVVGHLIRLQVVTQREEIALSQLVGATAADVRRPFLYHGVLQGMAGGALALGVAAMGVSWLDLELQALTSSYGADLKITFLTMPEGVVIVGSVVLLALAGAWLSVSRELRRFAAAA